MFGLECGTPCVILVTWLVSLLFVLVTTSEVSWIDLRLEAVVGTLSNGYTKSGPLPRVAPFRGPTSKLTRALAAHLSTITNAPYLGMVFGKHIT